MRKSLLMVGIPVSVLGLGLAGFMAVRFANRAETTDFAKELEKADAAGVQLAQSQAAKQFALNETAPQTKPEPKAVTKRGSGTKAVRSSTPTVRAAPEPVAADVVEEIPDLTPVRPTAAPTQIEATAPTLPTPSPTVEPAPAEDQGPILRGGNGGGNGDSGGGGGIGTVLGGVFGAVIRGGAVHGDNCDLHRRGPGPVNTTVQRPVYGGNPSGVAGVRTGGWGGRTGASPVISGGRVAARPRG